MITVLIVAGSYFSLLILLAILARPYRVRFAELANEILNDNPSDDVRSHVEWMTGTAYSIRTAATQFLTGMVLVVLPGDRLMQMAREFHAEHKELVDEDRISELSELHKASAAAVNPIFGLLALLARALFGIKVSSYSRRFHSDRKELEALQLRPV